MNPGGENRIGLWIEPLGPLFFRDGRPFSPSARLTSGLPHPQTLAGALRTFILERAGCDWNLWKEKMRDSAGEPDPFASTLRKTLPQALAVKDLTFRGPWLARKDDSGVTPYLPAPADLLTPKGQEGEVIRLRPLNPGDLTPIQQPPSPLLPLWHGNAGVLERLEGYFPASSLGTYLEGDLPAGPPIPSKELFSWDSRVGIGIHPDRLAAEEGLIYSASFLVLADKKGFYAEVEGTTEALNWIPSDGQSHLFSWGGEGRKALFTRREPFSWPRAGTENPGQPLALLTAPGLFAGSSWKPGGPPPVAAAVGGSVAVSGWDLTKGPQPTRFAAPAGSVYYFGESWVGNGKSLCENPDAALGWGTYLEGRWRP